MRCLISANVASYYYFVGCACPRYQPTPAEAYRHFEGRGHFGKVVISHG
jgi:hypothetical protein